MIQIYSPDNRDYTKNGNMTLFPTEATPKAELNGAWSATLTHPIDKDGRWKYIVEDAVVKMPSFNGDQLFRIISKKSRILVSQHRWSRFFMMQYRIAG